jgi:hypothetical protein
MSSSIDSETLEMTLDAIDDFVTDALPDKKLLEFDKNDEFPHDLVKELLGDGLGIQVVFIPLDYGRWHESIWVLPRVFSPPFSAAILYALVEPRSSRPTGWAASRKKAC